MNTERYRFIAEWFDSTVKIKREFLLSYFPSDNSIEMYDIVCKRIFLRKMKCDTVDASDMYVGSMINVLSRQLFITGFADKITAEKFGRELEATVVIINEKEFGKLGHIIAAFEKKGMTLSKGKMINRDKSSFNESSFSPNLEKNFIVFELRGLDAISESKKLLGMDNSNVGDRGLGELKNRCLVPTDKYTASNELKIFFQSNKNVHCNSATFENSTCCIIKPHALRDNASGKIIQAILNAGYRITALEILNFDLATASEFHEVYKGVVDEYKGMVSQLMSGPCIAMEISGNTGSKVPQDFRTFVGPADPEIAVKLRPGTLRASFGNDKVKNAVHCTDLPEDVKIELDYLFRVMFA